MNDEEINIAIAEACGWKICPFGEPLQPKTWRSALDLPDYCRDLNAMHEAEKTLNGTAMRVYEALLNPDDGFAIHANARQRAEAFIRTIGKWKEGAK